MAGRSDEALNNMKRLVEKRATSKPQDYKSFDEKCHDVALMGHPAELFGDINLNADQLLSLIDGHLRQHHGQDIGDESSEEPWDKVLRPVKLTVVSKEKAEDAATLKTFKHFVIEVQWDNDTVWRIYKTFEQCCALKETVEKELVHLMPIFTTNLQNSTPNHSAK